MRERWRFTCRFDCVSFHVKSTDYRVHFNAFSSFSGQKVPLSTPNTPNRFLEKRQSPFWLSVSTPDPPGRRRKSAETRFAPLLFFFFNHEIFRYHSLVLMKKENEKRPLLSIFLLRGSINVPRFWRRVKEAQPPAVPASLRMLRVGRFISGPAGSNTLNSKSRDTGKRCKNSFQEAEQQNSIALISRLCGKLRTGIARPLPRAALSAATAPKKSVSL